MPRGTNIIAIMAIIYLSTVSILESLSWPRVADELTTLSPSKSSDPVWVGPDPQFDDPVIYCCGRYYQRTGGWISQQGQLRDTALHASANPHNRHSSQKQKASLPPDQGQLRINYHQSLKSPWTMNPRMSTDCSITRQPPYLELTHQPPWTIFGHHHIVDMPMFKTIYDHCEPSFSQPIFSIISR